MATVADVLSIAIQHQQAGRLQAAEQIYRQVLTVVPRQAEVHNNLGIVLDDLGQTDDAVACYRRAVELKPDYAAAHSNLGNALRKQGKTAEAAACYRRAVEFRPDFAAAHYNLGIACRDQGNLDDAIASYRRAIELKPEFAEAHYNLGDAMKNLARLDEAVANYQRAVELKPGYAEAHNNLGIALSDLGRLDEAIASYRRALDLRPDYAEALSNLSIALKHKGRVDAAIACCRRAIELKPSFAEAHNNLGIALAGEGKLDEAVDCYRRTLELKPDHAEAYGNLGVALEEQGDLAGAEASFRAALRHNPRFALAHGRLAELLRGKLPESDLASLRGLLHEGNLPDSQRLLLHFGLAQVLDARGEYAAAASEVDQANALQLDEWRRRGEQYHPETQESFVSRMIAACTPDFFARVRGLGLEGPEGEIPVFIVGLPRSGTTLAEQILAGHPQVHAAGEITLARDSLAELDAGLESLDRSSAARLAARHLERLRVLSPAAARIVDKLPDNYLLLGLLAAIFPRAKFIHCRRDLRNVAVSCWMTRFRDVRWANDPADIGSRFQQYLRLMEHWRKVLPVPLLELNYEETVADLEGVARRLVSWCGLAWEPGCLEFHRARRPVTTASLVQVRQPIFATSVGRWHHYAPYLTTLLAAIPNQTRALRGTE